jgi:hypothetical protein
MTNKNAKIAFLKLIARAATRYHQERGTGESI